MGKQTFYLLRCRECSLFQNHIERKDGKWKCVCCNAPQAYDRVYAKSNLAKDLRPLAAQYNLRGIAAMAEAQAEAEAEDDRGDDLVPRQTDDWQQAEAEAGPVGDAWKEFGDGKGDDVADRRCQRADRPVCSDWERDSDARRIEEQRARFAKKPRRERTGVGRSRPAAAVAGAGVQDAWAAVPEPAVTAKLTCARGEARNENHNQNQNQIQIQNEWDAFLSDDDV